MGYKSLIMEVTIKPTFVDLIGISKYGQQRADSDAKKGTLESFWSFENEKNRMIVLLKEELDFQYC